MIWRLALIVLLGAGSLFFLLPPKARIVEERQGATRPVRGVVHIHTRRSDGTGTVEDVARAAARAGLSFVVITDHGDGTRKPDPPAYRQGVLCIDAVEISVDGGHLVAIGLPEAPYPLGGEARDAVEDVHRLGGWAVAAHPGSPKPDLAWRDWQAPVDGIEWVNGDSEWRDESALSLARMLLTYPFRPRESLATLLDRPDPVMKRWDELTAQRPVVGLAAADAHARVGLMSIGEPYDARASIPLPSYAAVFSALSVTLEGVSLSQDAVADARAVVDALRGGRLYSTIDGLATGGELTFTASSGQASAGMGQALAIDGPVTLRVETTAPPDARITIFRDGQPMRVVDGVRIEELVPASSAVYRVEVGLPGTVGTPPVPWMVGNPIYVGRRPAIQAVGVAPAPTSRVAFTIEQLGAARIERSQASEGATSITRVEGVAELLFRYALGGRASDHPYAAAALTLPASLDIGSLVHFTAHADRPMRLSVQLRSPGGVDGDRWRRSIYLDEVPRDLTVALHDMRPVTGVALENRLRQVDSLLFVVDAVHARLGNGGRVWIKNLELAK